MDSRTLVSALNYIYPDRKDHDIFFTTPEKINSIKIKKTVTYIVVFVPASKNKKYGHFVCFVRKNFNGKKVESSFFDTYNKKPNFYFKRLRLRTTNNYEFCNFQRYEESDCCLVVLYYLFLRLHLSHDNTILHFLHLNFRYNLISAARKFYFNNLVNFITRPSRRPVYYSLPKGTCLEYWAENQQNEQQRA